MRSSSTHSLENDRRTRTNSFTKYINLLRKHQNKVNINIDLIKKNNLNPIYDNFKTLQSKIHHNNQPKSHRKQNTKLDKNQSKKITIAEEKCINKDIVESHKGKETNIFLKHLFWTEYYFFAFAKA